MKDFSPYLRLFRNRYLLAGGTFIIWILFFDRNDLFTQWDRKKELIKLEASREYYQHEIKMINEGLADLQNNPAIIEKYARENFYLKRDNEDIFIVEENEEAKTNVKSQ